MITATTRIICDRTLGHPGSAECWQRVIRARADSPLYMLALDKEAGLLFAGGAMLSVQHLQEVRSLINVLQGEAPITLAEALPEQADNEQVHAVVRWLYEQAAIDVFT
jgi:hypothetical protein